MAKEPLPSPETLRQLLRYEPEAGKLFWRHRPMQLFATPRAFRAWNTRYSDQEAMTSINSGGYLQGHVLGAKVAAHRVVWAMEHNEWPTLMVDHIDGDKTNNRISNLRLATRSQNGMNRGAENNSKSVYVGVSPSYGRWRSTIVVDKKQISLGTFDDEVSAAQAYDIAAKGIHGEFARLNFPEVQQ